MTPEIYLDVFILDNYEKPKIQIQSKKAPREIQVELKSSY